MASFLQPRPADAPHAGAAAEGANAGISYRIEGSGPALLLLPFFLLALRGHSPHPTSPHADPCNDRAWLRAQWGQLALVALGVGFLVGGITIATVGVTDVFVR